MLLLKRKPLQCATETSADRLSLLKSQLHNSLAVQRAPAFRDPLRPDRFRGMELSEKEVKEAVQSFEALGVCSQLASAAAVLKWKRPTPVQEQAVPLLLQGKSAQLLCGTH